MLESIVSVHKWTEEFHQRLREEYGRLSDNVENMIIQLQEMIEAFNQACMVVVTETNGKVIEVNDAFCDVSGYRREELIGAHHNILKSGHSSSTFYEKIWKELQNGTTWTGELKHKRKDGTYYWVKTSFFPIPGEDGVPEKFISIGSEITALKSEEELRTAIEQDYSALIKNLHNFVIRTIQGDTNGPIITLLEGRLAEKIGITTETVKWKPVSTVIGDGNQQPLIRQNFKKAYAGQPVKFEYKQGNGFFHATLSPVTDRDGTVKEVVASVSDITELKNSELAVRNMAFHDPLTGLPNRRMLEEDLAYRLTDAKSADKRAAIILIDLDQFKNINDTLGHSVGDRFIMMAAERLQHLNLEGYADDFQLYHIGGDEFVWFIFGSDELELLRIVESSLKVFNERFQYKQTEIPQKASIGVAVFPDSADHPEELMKHADMALLDAKHSGGGTYRFFSADMKGAFLSRIRLESDLRQAVEQEQFRLVYQPVVRADDKKIISCEALVRWVHPEKGMISPAEFIPAAEESGLIIPIGDFVVKQACRDLKKWDELLGNEDLIISVNISASQLQQAGFVRRLKSIVQEYNVRPGRIQLELTENSVMENTVDSINTLQKLRDSGFTIAIDDFGTGYSSLSYLKQFPVNCLKVDRSFVKDLPGDRADRAIVSSTIKLGKDLGLFMVAEGVECQEAYEYLNSIGCPYVQGFYFSKPVPADKFIGLLINN
ncbi:EAL and GGDEF domain-containing protein [Evansella clarkii]|uniref:sensor domain-containing protein n=1 Tax=Evansella clarkii TaxID=79879 RepID=UPI00099867F3|nr:EAL domain-containing protein [Evansella clarkii]